jgi:hypothetical protein
MSGNDYLKTFNYLYFLPYYRAFEFMNRHLAPSHRVVFLGEDRTFYLKRHFIASSFNDRNLVIQSLKATTDFTAFQESLKARGITHMLFSDVGLARMARSSSLYRLTPGDFKRLNEYLGRLSLVYRDSRYRIFKL